MGIHTRVILLLLTVATSIVAMDKNNKHKNKNREMGQVAIEKHQNNEQEDFVLDAVCPKCNTQWLAQTDECPGCGQSTGLGDGYDVMKHKYFLPKQ